MKFALGFLAGAGTVWAALAIWQQFPPFSAVDDIDPDDVPGVCPQGHKIFEDEGSLDRVMPLETARRPGYDSVSFSVEGGRISEKQAIKHARSAIPYSTKLIRLENVGGGVYRATYKQLTWADLD